MMRLATIGPESEAANNWSVLASVKAVSCVQQVS